MGITAIDGLSQICILCGFLLGVVVGGTFAFVAAWCVFNSGKVHIQPHRSPPVACPDMADCQADMAAEMDAPRRQNAGGEEEGEARLRQRLKLPRHLKAFAINSDKIYVSTSGKLHTMVGCAGALLLYIATYYLYVFFCCIAQKGDMLTHFCVNIPPII
jgi:hypothetical protein